MIIPDMNVLVYAHREEAEDHQQFKRWLENLVNSDESYGVSEIALSEFVRIVTHRRVFAQPSPLSDALAFVEDLRGQPNCVVIAPGNRHWEIFLRLCRTSAARGNLVPDAYFAALAIESGSEWITTDRDFARFPGLRWRHPL